MPLTEPVLTSHVKEPFAYALENYRRRGGYEGMKKALALPPDQVIEVVKQSGLRGRGGAGFSTGMKWGFVPKDSPKPKYLCVNADESEPGTFKDRYIMDLDPHKLIEGIIITCWAIRSHDCYVYIRGEYESTRRNLQVAVDEAYAAGLLGDDVAGRGFKLHVTIHKGAGAYICGEETGLLFHFVYGTDPDNSAVGRFIADFGGQVGAGISPSIASCTALVARDISSLRTNFCSACSNRN